MAKEEGLKIIGVAKTTLTHDDGRVEVFEQHNMIVNTGFSFIISSMIKSGSDRPNPMGYIALGTGKTAAKATDTALEKESFRKQGTWSWSTGAKSFTIKASWNKGEVTGVITECGVFNAATGGTMLDRLIFSTPFTGASDIQYTQELTFTVA